MLRAQDLFISLASLILVIALVNFSLLPFSLVNFIGAIAGASAALVVLKGYKMLISILINLLVIKLFAIFYFDIGFSAEFIAVSILSITLQSVWSAQLTANEMKGVSWLSSRQKLSRFLIKLGPVSSLVSAFSVIVLLLITNEFRDTGFLYIFVLNWSVSMLVTIFLLPTLLFASELPKVARNKRLQVIVASILAAIALSIFFRVSQNDHQHKRLDEFNQATHFLTDEIDLEFSRISQTIKAMYAFFSASESITKKEFETFAAHIFEESESTIALAWLPTVAKSQAKEFEIKAAQEYERTFSIRALRKGPFSPSEIEDISFHAPIYFAYPILANQHAVGLDLTGDKARFKAMVKAAQLNQTVSSQPITLIDQEASNPGMLMFTPIFSSKKLNPFGNVSLGNKDNLDGFIVAVVQLKPVLDRLVNNPIAKKVSINVQDVTTTEPYFLYGVSALSGNYLTHHIDRFEFNRLWRLEIVERSPWVSQPRNWLTWVVLLGCTVGGLLYQFLILLMSAYSLELNQKVSDKTKELIIQKEQSEDQNKAKTQFLVNLSNELKTPIGALSGLLSQLNEQVSNSKLSNLIEKINSISSTLKQSIDTLSDLSEIESGKLTFQEEAFDFHLFLQQVETMINVNTDLLVVNVNFQFDENIPHYVMGDKLRLQQLIVALVHNSALIFNHDHLSVSIKSHRHLRGSVTIFIVITPEKKIEGSTIPSAVAEKEFENLTTSMTIAKEISQRLDGAINLAPVAETGDYMLSASFKLKLDESAQQVAIKLDESLIDLSTKNIFILGNDIDVNMTISAYLEKFDCSVEVYQQINERSLEKIAHQDCDILFLACLTEHQPDDWIKSKIQQLEKLNSAVIVVVAPEHMSIDKLSNSWPELSFYLSKPIKPSALADILSQLES